MEFLKTLLQNRYAQLALALFGGITIGAIFYPTSHIEETTRQKVVEEYSLKMKEQDEKHSKETQTLKDSLTAEQKSHSEYKEEITKKVDKLTVENTSLKQKSKRKTYKLVKPDGTIIETEVDESSTEQTTQVVTRVKEEFNKKVQSIEDKWEKIHKDRVAEITKENDEKVFKLTTELKKKEAELETSKTVDTNKKSLRPEVGVTTNRDAYFHASYSLWGPVFVGGGVSGTNTHFGDGRLGLGVEF